MFLLRTITLQAIPAIFLLTSACSSGRVMQNNARSAADQVVQIQREIQEKVEVEEAFYDAELDSIADSIHRSRRVAIEEQLENDARNFVAANGGGAVTGDTLVSFLQSEVQAWKTAETQRQQLLTQVTDQLDTGRQKLDASVAQLEELQNKLRALGEARSNKALEAFIFGFVQQTVEGLQKGEAVDSGEAP